MEENEKVKKYEMVVIVDAKLNADEKEDVRKQVSDAITGAGGKVINSQVWFENQKLTFEIKKCTEGTYYLINFDGEGSVSEKIKPILKLNEKILRISILQVASPQRLM
jgi:small subunit ribosomal protein S6